MQDIKVYHILDHYIPEYSGYTFRSGYILKNQKQHGLKPSAIVSPLYTQGLKTKEIIEGIEFNRSILNGQALKHNIPFLKQYQLMRFFEKDIFSFLKLKPKGIIHAHSPVLCGIPAFKVAKRLNLPIVYEVRALWEDAAVDLGRATTKSLRYQATRFLETNLLKKVDKVITICEGLKKELIQRGIREEKIEVIPNGVDTKKFSPIAKDTDLVAKYNLKGKTVLGFIGSFYNYEGLIQIVKAMPKILAYSKDIRLLLVGKGNDQAILKDLVKCLGLEDKVVFTGQVAHEAILKFYSVIDICVYPREKIRLTDLVTPLKPLEAMAMEKAVIASDVGGHKELIEDRVSGLLFESGNYSDLAEKCIDLVKNPDRRKELGKRGRGYVIEQRNWQKIISKYLKIYPELIAQIEKIK